MNRSWFQGKKIVVMGLGLHGGARALCQWLFAAGAVVIATDLKKRNELEESIRVLDAWCRSYRLAHADQPLVSIEYHLGGHNETDFFKADLVVQNPGVPADSPYLAGARKHGVPIENEATLFFRLTPHVPKIAVTGTRGKSTTVSLLSRIFSEWNPNCLSAGVATDAGVTAFFDIIDRLVDGVPAIVELSSWHCDLFSTDREVRAATAVLTNITPDHLNRYPHFKSYAAAKESLVACQTDGDLLIVNADNELTRALGDRWQDRRTVVRFSRTHSLERGTWIQSQNGKDSIVISGFDGGMVEVCAVDDIVLSGTHNLENCLAAASVAAAWTVSPDIVRHVLTTFSGVPGRQERIAAFGGRAWVNDTTSTTPVALVAALSTLTKGGRDIVLIAGGADKSLLYEGVVPTAMRSVRSLIALSGTATPKLVDALVRGGCSQSIRYANSMDEAVRLAWQESENGDTIVLSPGAASFGQFVNEFDRGRAFHHAVEQLRRELTLQNA